MVKMDFKEALEMFKEQNKEMFLEVDTMDVIENVNPELTKTSKKYKDSDNFIFKNNIRYENAEELINLAMELKHNNLQQYKQTLRDKCNLITILGESPTEMLVYSIKALSENENAVNCIIDELKNLKDNDKFFMEAYRNILINWSWNECLEIVLKSIQDLYLTDLAEQVYYVFEDNNTLRELAAKTLVDIDAEKYFESIVNFLVANDDGTTQSSDLLRNISYYIGKNSSVGSEKLYTMLIKIKSRNAISSALINGIRVNLTPVLYDKMERALKNPQYGKSEQNKIINVLSRSMSYYKSQELLNKAKEYSHLDFTRIISAIGGKDSEINKELAIDTTRPISQRIIAIQNLGRLKDDVEVNAILRKIYNESDTIKIASSASLVEQGETKEILVLFKYIIAAKEGDEIGKQASSQIRRLRAKDNEELNKALLTVAEKLLQDDSIVQFNKIYDVYLTGKIDDSIAYIFLKKLKSTKYNIIKKEILTLFSRNIGILGENITREIGDEIVNCSRIEELQEEAMRCLKAINVAKDFTPILGE